MTATTALDEMAHLKKWDEEKMVQILLEFIEFEKDLDEEFVAFLVKKSIEE